MRSMSKWTCYAGAGWTEIVYLSYSSLQPDAGHCPMWQWMHCLN